MCDVVVESFCSFIMELEWVREGKENRFLSLLLEWVESFGIAWHF